MACWKWKGDLFFSEKGGGIYEDGGACEGEYILVYKIIGL